MRQSGLMHLGIFAKTFPGSRPEAVLQQVAAAGYTQAQYNMACSGLAAMPDAISHEEAQSVAAAARAAHVSIAAVSGTYNMIHPDPTVRTDGLRRLAVLASRCGAMGAPLITLCTGTRNAQDQWHHHPDNTTPAAWHDLLLEMAKVLAIAETHDVQLGIEPEQANVVDSAEKARALLDHFASPRLRIVFDAANLIEGIAIKDQPRMIAQGIDLLAGDIAMVHAKDRAADGRVVAAGQGTIDFKHYLGSLRRAGFAGPVITHGLSAAEAPAVARFLTETLAQIT